MYRDCTAACPRCQERHHSLLCPKSKENAGTVPEQKKPGKVSIGTCTLAADSSAVETSVVMQTIRVEIQGEHDSVCANILFDSGSDCTYVSKDLVERTGPEFVRSETVSYCNFGSGKPQGEALRNLYTLELHGHDNNGSGVVLATEVPTICSPLYRKRLPEHILRSFPKMKLADNYSTDRNMTIDLLIGLDNYWKFIEHEVTPVMDGLVLMKTLFGWMVSGCYEGKDTDPRVSHQLFCVSDAEL